MSMGGPSALCNANIGARLSSGNYGLIHAAKCKLADGALVDAVAKAAKSEKYAAHYLKIEAKVCRDLRKVPG